MEANSENSSSSAVPSKNIKKGKVLIPWRDPIKGPLLRVAMFKLALVERIYFKAAEDKRKSDERWQDFAVKLFAQPEFKGMEGSFRTIKEQLDSTLKVRK